MVDGILAACGIVEPPSLTWQDLAAHGWTLFGLELPVGQA